MSNARRSHDHADTAELSAELAELREQIKSLKVVGQDVVKGKVQAAKEGSTRILNDGREKLEHAGEEVMGFVREKPLKALAIAGGVGLLLGLFSRKQ